jgi:hypothetical protein
VTTLSGTVSAVTLFSGAAGVAVQADRLASARQMAACGSGEFLLEPLGLLDSPLGLAIGPQPLAYARGAVVGNVAVLVACAAFFFGVAGVYSAWRATPMRVALARLRLPGLLYVPAAVLIGGEAQATASLVAHGTTAMDAGFAVVGAVLGLALPLGAVALLCIRSKTAVRYRAKAVGAVSPVAEQRRAKPSPRASADDVEMLAAGADNERRGDAATASADASTAAAATAGMPAAAAEASDARPTKQHFIARACPRLYAAYRWIAVSRGEWVDVAPSDEIVDISPAGAAAAEPDELRTRRLHMFTLANGTAFEDYHAAVYCLIDMAITVHINAATGVAAGFVTRPACLMWLGSCVLVLGVYAVHLVVAAPLLSRGLQWFTATSTAVSAVATLLAVLQFLHRELDYDTGWLSLSLIEVLLSVVAMALSLMSFVSTVAQFVGALRKGRVARVFAAALTGGDVVQAAAAARVTHNDFHDTFMRDLDMALLETEIDESLRQAVAPAPEAARNDSDFIDLSDFLAAPAPAPEPEPEPTVVDTFALDDGDDDALGGALIDDSALDLDDLGDATLSSRVGRAEIANLAQQRELQRLLNAAR